MDDKTKAAEVLSELMLKGLTKAPELAAKQRRLLAILARTQDAAPSDGAGAEQPPSTDDDPAQPR